MFLQRNSPDSGLRSESGQTRHDALRGAWTFDPWEAFFGRLGVPTTIDETEDGLVVRLELPGVDPELLEVQVSGHQLTISLQVQDEAEAGQKAAPTHRFRSFRETIQLPVDVDPETAVADSRHGVLTVRLSKPADKLPKRITVKAS